MTFAATFAAARWLAKPAGTHLSGRSMLYPFQQTAVQRTIAALPNRPILAAPTGSGKTVMGVEVIRRLSVPTVWLAHRQELIEQAAARLTSEGLYCGIIMPGYPAQPLAPVQVASIQTLVNRDMPPGSLVVIDECHHAISDSFKTVLNKYGPAWRLGLTATPFRLDGRGLGDLFGEIVQAATVRELCDLGTLHAPRVYASRTPDLRGVKVTLGDYAPGALAERCNTQELNADIPQTWLKRANGMRTVAFAVDVAHSLAIVQAFKEVEVAAEHIDGQTSRMERAGVLRRLATGETQVVSNCLVLTEGWDLPQLECAIIARPTASLCLHLQMIGRVMRACVGKGTSIVLDHAGNTHVHGLVTRRLEYSLDGRKAGESEPLGLRRCLGCGLYFDEPACPECGMVPEAGSGGGAAGLVHGNGELAEYAETFAYRRDVWRLLEAERVSQGFKDGWAWFRFKERFDMEPVLAPGPNGLDLVDPEHATMAEKESVYLRLRGIAAERGFKEGWASHQYKQAFGVWPSGFVGRSRITERFKQARKWATG